MQVSIFRLLQSLSTIINTNIHLDITTKTILLTNITKSFTELNEIIINNTVEKQKMKENIYKLENDIKMINYKILSK